MVDTSWVIVSRVWGIADALHMHNGKQTQQADSQMSSHRGYLTNICIISMTDWQVVMVLHTAQTNSCIHENMLTPAIAWI